MNALHFTPVTACVIALIASPWVVSPSADAVAPSLAADGEMFGAGWFAVLLAGEGSLAVDVTEYSVRAPIVLMLHLLDLNLDGIGPWVNVNMDDWGLEHVQASPPGMESVEVWGLPNVVSDEAGHGAGVVIEAIAGPRYLVGVVAGDLERWTYRIETTGGLAVVSRTEGRSVELKLASEFESVAAVEVQEGIVGARATIEGRLEHEIPEGAMLSFFKAPALTSLPDGVQSLRITTAGGERISCPCHFENLAGPQSAPSGVQEFALNGAAAHAFTGEAVFLVVATPILPD